MTVEFLWVRPSSQVNVANKPKFSFRTSIYNLFIPNLRGRGLTGYANDKKGAILMDHTALRAEIYRLLSEAYKQPTAEYIKEQPAIVVFLRKSLRELNYELPSSLYENWPALFHDLPVATAAFRLSFLFPVQSRIIPVESIYRRWSQDATTDIAFANEKGLLLSDHALHMKTLYTSYGITAPPEYQSMPDHICLELEFAALLLETQETERHALFAKEHLDWLDELAEDAEKFGVSDYYRQVVKLTAQFLSLELRR